MNLRHTLSIIAGLAMAFGAGADQLTPEEALGRVQALSHRGVRMSRNVDVQPLLTVASPADNGFKGVYVFDNGSDGFLVVSADDCAIPLLGYSDTAFDSSNIPPQLEAWLDFYAEEIAWASKAGVSSKGKKTSSRPVWAPVAPMIKTKWNQDAPFNMYCPEKNGERCPTGCVATAMSQIMKYYEWPQKGKGSNSYKLDGFGTISCDFSEMTFDWKNMLNEYDGMTSKTANKAVGNLMFATGVSVDMQYSLSGSGAPSLYIPGALYEYFDYDISMYDALRARYTTPEWEALIYGELAAGRPVIYGGNAESGGHEFICDGYDSDGYFHFNWGWSGSNDGYFTLSTLDPYDQGIGGAGVGEGFIFSQEVVINLQPAKEGSVAGYHLECLGQLLMVNSDMDYVEDGDYVDLGDFIIFYDPTRGIRNMSCVSVAVTMGLKLTKENGQTIYLPDPEGDITDWPSGASLTMAVFDLPADLADGTYDVSLVYMPKGTSTWLEIPSTTTAMNTFSFKVANGKAQVTYVEKTKLYVTDWEFKSPVYLGKPYKADITFTNFSDHDGFVEFMVDVYNEDMEYVGSSESALLEISAGETLTINYVGTMPSADYMTGKDLTPGNYYFAVNDNYTFLDLYDEDGDFAEAAVSNPVDPKVNYDLKVTGVSVGSQYVTANVDYTANCLEGVFSEWIYLVLYPGNFAGSNFSNSSIQMVDLGTHYAWGGESVKISSNVSFYPQNGYKDYTLFFGFVTPDYKIRLNTDSYCVFTAEDTGIGSVQAEEGSIALVGDEIVVSSTSSLAEVDVYSIGGTLVCRKDAAGTDKVTVNVSGLQKGAYIVVATDASGARNTAKIVL